MTTSDAINSPHVYQDLVEAIATGAILFVGAGSSKRVGYPDWPTTLETIANECRSRNAPNASSISSYDKNDAHIRAGAYKRFLGPDPFLKVLCGIFAPRETTHDDFHEILVRMPFRYTITTNYEDVLENAHNAVHENTYISFGLDDHENTASLIGQSVDQRPSGQYFHLHGSIRRPQTIIITEQDYNQQYVADSRATYVLSVIMSVYTTVFVGYSLADHDIRYILRSIKAKLGTSKRKHFMLLRFESPERSQSVRNECEEFLIEPVFFEDPSGDYSGLHDFVKGLERDVQAAVDINTTKLFSKVAPSLPFIVDRKPELKESLSSGLRILDQLKSLAYENGDQSTGISEIDREITSAYRFVNKGLPDETLAELQDIKTRHADHLSDKQRYRILANTAHAHYSKDEFDTAGGLYLEATCFYKDSNDAKYLEILGNFLLKREDRALALAKILIESDPDFARPYSILVKVLPDTVAFSDIEAMVPDAIKSNEEVAVALSSVANKRDNPEKELEYARLATNSAPDWPIALASLGGAILRIERDHAFIDASKGPLPRNSERAIEAEDLFTAAIDKTPKTGAAKYLGILFFNRALCRRMLQDEDGAKSDLHEALIRSPQEHDVVFCYAAFSQNTAERSQALKALETVPVSDEEAFRIQFMKAFVLVQRHETNDIESARTILEDMIRRIAVVQPAKTRVDVLQLALEVFGTLHQLPYYKEVVANIEHGLVPAHIVELLLGRIGLRTKDTAAALEHAHKALLLYDETQEWIERRDIILLAQDCRLYKEAFDRWRSLLDTDVISHDTVYLLQTGYAAGEWKMVLDYCETYRNLAPDDWTFLDIELRILSQTNAAFRGIKLLEEWLTRNPNHKKATLYLSVLLIETGQALKAVYSLERLPAIGQLKDADEGAMVCSVLAHGPEPESAERFAYESLRRFPESETAQTALLHAAINPFGKRTAIPHPTHVGAGCAVLFGRSREVPRWIFIEDENPSLVREEYNSSHLLVQAMWNCGAGEAFEFGGAQYVVREIQSASLRRAQEIMESFEEDFPTQVTMKRFDVSGLNDPNASLETRLGDVGKHLRQRNEVFSFIENRYRQNECPITSFANRTSHTVLDIMRYISANKNLVLRSASGDNTDWINVVSDLKANDTVVMDSTALATACNLGIFETLRKLNLRMVVPYAVQADLRRQLLDILQNDSRGGRIGMQNGRFFFNKFTAEYLSGEVKLIEGCLDFVDKHCEIGSGVPTLNFAVSVRENMKRALGGAATDAIAIAIDRKAYLWTDDYALQEVIGVKHGLIKCVWTQAILCYLLKAGNMSQLEYATIIVKMIRHRYEFMYVATQDVVAVMRGGLWNPRNANIVCIIDYIMRYVPRNTSNQDIVTNVLLLIWEDCSDKADARNLILWIIDRLRGKVGIDIVGRTIERFRGKEFPGYFRPLLRTLKALRPMKKRPRSA